MVSTPACGLDLPPERFPEVGENLLKIGKLGAIAIIRTALNFFLMREMAEERAGE